MAVAEQEVCSSAGSGGAPRGNMCQVAPEPPSLASLAPIAGFNARAGGARVAPRCARVKLLRTAKARQRQDSTETTAAWRGFVGLGACGYTCPQVAPVHRGMGLAGQMREAGSAAAGAPTLQGQRLVPALQADGAARRLDARVLVPALLPVLLLARAVAVELVLAPAALFLQGGA